MVFDVLASVTRLTQRVGSFEEALSAFRSARFQACISNLNGVETGVSALLRSRTLLRLGKPVDARSALRDMEWCSNREQGEASLLLAVAHSRLGDAQAAQQCFRDAHVFSISSLDVALEAEVEYYEGLSAFALGDLSESRFACLRGFEIVKTPPQWTKSNGIIPVEHVISRTEELFAIIHASEGEYRKGLGYTRAALATLDRCKIGDVFQEAFALKNLTVTAREFDIDEDARLLGQRVPALAWTSDLSRVEFAAVEALGWCSALRGDHVGALRLFRRAAAVASTEPERVIVGVDRALIARAYGHTAMVTEEIEHALGIANAFNWDFAGGDSRYALLTLAQVAAPIEVALARKSLNRYNGIRTAMDATFAARIEPRIRAEEAYTHGLVLRAEGRIDASTERLRSAFETWNRIGYEWRAGRAALELAEMNAGDMFRLAVHRELRTRPDSIFAARARLVA